MRSTLPVPRSRRRHAWSGKPIVESTERLAVSAAGSVVVTSACGISPLASASCRASAFSMSCAWVSATEIATVSRVRRLSRMTTPKPIRRITVRMPDTMRSSMSVKPERVPWRVRCFLMSVRDHPEGMDDPLVPADALPPQLDDHGKEACGRERVRLVRRSVAVEVVGHAELDAESGVPAGFVRDEEDRSDVGDAVLRRQLTDVERGAQGSGRADRVDDVLSPGSGLIRRGASDRVDALGEGDRGVVGDGTFAVRAPEGREGDRSRARRCDRDHEDRHREDDLQERETAPRRPSLPSSPTALLLPCHLSLPLPEAFDSPVESALCASHLEERPAKFQYGAPA